MVNYCASTVLGSIVTSFFCSLVFFLTVNLFSTAFSDKTKVSGEKENVDKRLLDVEAELKRIKKDLHEERQKHEVSYQVTGSVEHMTVT